MEYFIITKAGKKINSTCLKNYNKSIKVISKLVRLFIDKKSNGFISLQKKENGTLSCVSTISIQIPEYEEV